MPRLRATLVFLTMACAFAQNGKQTPPDPAAIVHEAHEHEQQLAKQWLASGDPRTVAWGASLASRDLHGALLPDLLNVLRAHTVTPQPASLAEVDEHNAMLAVLDAILEIHGDVSGADAVKLYPEFPAQALILLSRSQDDINAPLLEIFNSSNDRTEYTLTAGNLLASRRAPGFAATVLNRITIHSLVSVFNEGSGGGFGGGSLCCGVGGSMPDKAGWPAVGTYGVGVCDNPGQGSVLFASGSPPILLLPRGERLLCLSILPLLRP